MRSTKGLITEAYFHTGKYFDNHWHDALFCQIPVGELDSELVRLTTRFLNNAEMSVLKDGIQRRAIVKLIWDGTPRFFLLARVVPNPGKVYKQTDGLYNGTPRMQVIGKRIITGDLSLKQYVKGD